MSVAAASPASSDIVPRNVDFILAEDRIMDWQGGDRAKTVFWNALSLMFPHGERFFIDAVVKNRGVVKAPRLAADVKAFVQQEAYHTREHIAYNAAMNRVLDAAKLEAELLEHLEFVKRVLPPAAPLLVTCALEHFTAIMAKVTLEDPVFLADAEPSFARLWSWHALEECEHKAVSYDVYLAKYGGDRKVWARRRVMFLATITLVRFIAKHIVAIMKAQGMARDPIAWKNVVGYIFGEPGLMRRIVPFYLQYYRKDFHPNDIDDRAELARGRGLVAAFARS